MTVSQLIYVSRAKQYVDRRELVDLAVAVSENNRRLGVTGCLLYCNGYFLQVLEGNRLTIDTLLTTIRQDIRHTDTQVVFATDGVARQFSDWSMGHLHQESMSPEQNALVSAWTSRVVAERDSEALGQDARELLHDLHSAIAQDTSAACAVVA